MAFYLSGKSDIIQEPVNISEMARNNIPFYMFIDEETHSYLKNTSRYSDDNKRVGLWAIIVVHNVPYTDARRNGKVRERFENRFAKDLNVSLCNTFMHFLTDSEASVA